MTTEDAWRELPPYRASKRSRGGWFWREGESPSILLVRASSLPASSLKVGSRRRTGNRQGFAIHHPYVK